MRPNKWRSDLVNCNKMFNFAKDLGAVCRMFSRKS